MAIGTDRYFVHPDMNIICSSVLAPSASWSKFVDLTRKLKNREITGNEAKSTVNRFLASCRPILMKWYCRILNHDLRIGVDKLTVQKIWGDTFLLSNSSINTKWHFNNCALAKAYDSVTNTPEVTFPLAVEAKLDGERALILCFPRDNEIVLFTRSGRRRQFIEQTGSFRDQIVTFTKALNGDDENRPIFFDGEFLAKKWNDTSSIVRKTKNFDEAVFLSNVRLFLWDWAPLNRYLAGSFDMKWTRRKAELLHAAGATKPTSKPVNFSANICVLGHTLVYDVDQLLAEYERCVDTGYEGVVLKKPYTPHTFKRSTNLLKLKPEKDVSGRIVGFYPGLAANAAVVPAVARKVTNLMQVYGEIKITKQYIHCKTSKTQKLVAQLKDLIQGDNELRISMPRDGIVSFRHGVRLGGFIVELDDGVQVRVGGGYKTKAGNDERALFWRKRDDYVGMYIDLRVQDTKTADANGRFNRFLRLREDL
jgi:hypothetical protein